MSLPASKRFVSINCNNYVKVSKIDDISVNSTVHDDCALKRNKYWNCEGAKCSFFIKSQEGSVVV